MNLLRKLFPKSATVEHQNGRIDIQAQRWAVSYVPFPVVDCGVIGRGQNMETMPPIQVGSQVIALNDRGDYAESYPPPDNWSTELGPILYCNQSSMRGAWFATNPMRKRTLFFPVSRNAGKWEKMAQLRYLAAKLQCLTGKSRFGFISRLLTRFEDRPAADALCRYIAEHAAYDEEMRKRPMLSPHQKFLAARKAREEASKEAE